MAISRDREYAIIVNSVTYHQHLRKAKLAFCDFFIRNLVRVRRATM